MPAITVAAVGPAARTGAKDIVTTSAPVTTLARRIGLASS